MGIYIGVRKPIREETTQTVTVNIDENNISEYFDVANGSTYYFAGNGGVFTSNNGAKESSSATTDLTLKRDLAVSFDYSYSSEANYDKFTLKVGSTTVENAVSGATTSKRYAKTQLAAGTVIAFKYAKDSSMDKNDDKCTFSNMVVEYQEMVQGEITGYAEVAQKVAKMYVGVDGTARKVRRGYIGVGGVAIPFFVSGEAKKVDGVTGLSAARKYLRGARAGTCALFAGGGSDSSTAFKNVDCYAADLTRTLLSSGLPAARMHQGAASAEGVRAVFAGGCDGEYISSTTVTAFDSTLTRAGVQALSTARYKLCGASLGQRLYFAGGQDDDGAVLGTVDSYDSSLVRTALTALGVKRYDAAGTGNDAYVLICGGYGGSTVGYVPAVDAYDAAGTRTAAAAMSEGKSNAGGTRVGRFAILCGGYITNGANGGSKAVEAYDEHLTRTLGGMLTVSHAHAAAASFGACALVAGGFKGVNSAATAVAELIDDSLTCMPVTSLGTARFYLAAAAAGSYILFAGGTADGAVRSAADAYYFE